MAFIQLKPGTKNYRLCRDKFLEVRHQMMERFGQAQEDGANRRELEVEETRFIRVSPRAIVRHLQDHASEQPDSWSTHEYLMGRVCFNSPTPPKDFDQLETCFHDPYAIGVEMRGALRLYQYLYKGSEISSLDIMDIVDVIAEERPHVTMLLGDVDGNGIDDVFLIAANGAFRMYLGNDKLSHKKRLKHFRKVNLFGARTRIRRGRSVKTKRPHRARRK